MSRVITFSRVFPKDHPKAGQPTYFVEKIYNSLFSRNNLMDYPKGLEINDTIIGIKKHTIRNGAHWKVGDKFSPRVWSGKPYNTKQIILCDDLEVKQVFDIEIYPTYEVMLNGIFFCSFGSKNWYALSHNDGLSSEDMRNWFSELPFKGQIICWTDDYNYN